MNLYVVDFINIFKEIYSETNELFFTEENEEKPFLIEASSKKYAARMFLEHQYDVVMNNVYTSNTCNDEIMDYFIECSLYGNAFIEVPENKEAVDKLSKEVYDFISDLLKKAGKLKEESFGTGISDLSDREIIDTRMKFPSHLLKDLLTDDEWKEAYIQANMKNIGIIELQKL